MTAGEELEAALNRGWSFDELEVYADHLLSKNDPRGDVIALDLSPRPEQQTWLNRRRAAMGAWLGNDVAARAGHLVQHGFLHELRDGMFPHELLDSPAGTYLRGYVTWGRTRVLASLERLAKKPRPWLSRLTIAHHDTTKIPEPVVRAVIAATPRLEEVCIVGQKPFEAFPHPNVKRAVLDARCYSVEIEANKTRIEARDLAAGPRVASEDLDLLMELVELAPDCNQLYMHGADFSEPLPALVVRLAAAGLVELAGPVVRVASPDTFLGITRDGRGIETADLPNGRGTIHFERAPDWMVANLSVHATFIERCINALPLSARMTDTLVDYVDMWRRAYSGRITIDSERVARLRASFNALLELRSMFEYADDDAEQWLHAERTVGALATDSGAWFSRPYDFYWY